MTVKQRERIYDLMILFVSVKKKKRKRILESADYEFKAEILGAPGWLSWLKLKEKQRRDHLIISPSPYKMIQKTVKSPVL